MLKEIIESLSINEFGFHCDGKPFSLSLQENSNNGMLELSIIGSPKLITNVKSFSDIANDYSEQDVETLRKYYKKLYSNANKKLCNALKKFNDEVNSIIKELENQTKKL
jgi:hypothetical protein